MPVEAKAGDPIASFLSGLGIPNTIMDFNPLDSNSFAYSTQSFKEYLYSPGIVEIASFSPSFRSSLTKIG